MTAIQKPFHFSYKETANGRYFCAKQASLTGAFHNDLYGVLLSINAQVQCQVDHRLAVNYGVRWEYRGPYRKAVPSAMSPKG